MSDLTNVFTDIADAIRAKTETQITYKPTEMANAINNISGGGGVFEVTTGRVTSSFNMPVSIPEGVTNMAMCFQTLVSFNQLVNIPNTVTNMSQCFSGCHEFNQPVTFPNSVERAENCFQHCTNFNQPVSLSDALEDMFSVFYNCQSFNQPVVIPRYISGIQTCFFNCISFNQPLYIPSDVFSMHNLLNNCTSFGSNIYVNASSALSSAGARNMFRNCNNSLPKHIFTHNTRIFNGTATTNSITGTAITWTQDGANYYNTAYNIYIHNVADPYTILNNADYQFDSQRPLPNSPAIVFGSGVRNLHLAFYGVGLISDNTLIMFEEGVENLSACFYEQSMFNQPVTIPSSAVDCSALFVYCENFNSPVVFRNGVEDISDGFEYCQNFDKDVWIPESVTNLRNTFRGCTAFESGSGIVHISHNIALGNTSNYIYSAFTVISGEDGTESGLFTPLDPSRILNDY